MWLLCSARHPVNENGKENEGESRRTSFAVFGGFVAAIGAVGTAVTRETQMNTFTSVFALELGCCIAHRLLLGCSTQRISRTELVSILEIIPIFIWFRAESRVRVFRRSVAFLLTETVLFIDASKAVGIAVTDKIRRNTPITGEHAGRTVQP